jgi:hypothetical protein
LAWSGSAAVCDHLVPAPGGGLIPTPLTFVVVGDGKVLWKSKPVDVARQVQDFDVDVTGFEVLELCIDCPGSHVNAQAVWVEPRVTVKQASAHADVDVRVRFIDPDDLRNRASFTASRPLTVKLLTVTMPETVNKSEGNNVLQRLTNGTRWWSGSVDDAAEMVSKGRPGDLVPHLAVKGKKRVPYGTVEEWVGLRFRLSEKGFAIVAVGANLFLAPMSAEADLPQLREIAACGACGDSAARAALSDLAHDLFNGEVPGLAETLMDVSSAGHKPAEVPGGALPLLPRQRGQTAPATVNVNVVRSLHRRVAKLSRLQREILAFASHYAMGNRDGDSAPLHLRRTTTNAAAAAQSRALRRLEARGLIVVVRSEKGRATHVRLTEDGRRVTSPDS